MFRNEYNYLVFSSQKAAILYYSYPMHPLHYKYIIDLIWGGLAFIKFVYFLSLPSLPSFFSRLEKENIQHSFSNEAKTRVLQAQQREQDLTQKMRQMEAQHDKTGRWSGKIRAWALTHKPGPCLTVK